MHPILRNIIAVILGWIGGSILNISIVELGHALMPIEGLDTQDMESLAAIYPTVEPQYLVFPFLAHALGTLLGGFIAAKIAATRPMAMALVVGGIFFVGGIMVSQMIPTALWFTLVDLIFAYFPMAWIGGRLARR